MKNFELKFPEIVFLGVTHLVLGAGLSLLAADSLSRNQRKIAGGALLAIGLATAVPRVAILLEGKRRDQDEHEGASEDTSGARTSAL